MKLDIKNQGRRTTMNNTFEVWGAFDEDDVLLDYSLSEEDVREWAYDRFEKEMVSIAKMTIHEREQVKIRNLRDPYQEMIDD
jgi:hypothetical protein